MTTKGDDMGRFIKRVGYERVRISCLGGSVELAPATSGDGWSATFETHKDMPIRSYGKDLEAAAAELIGDLRRRFTAIEEDLKAFIERNR